MSLPIKIQKHFFCEIDNTKLYKNEKAASQKSRLLEEEIKNLKYYESPVQYVINRIKNPDGRALFYSNDSTLHYFSLVKIPKGAQKLLAAAVILEVHRLRNRFNPTNFCANLFDKKGKFNFNEFVIYLNLSGHSYLVEYLNSSYFDNISADWNINESNNISNLSLSSTKSDYFIAPEKNDLFSPIKNEAEKNDEFFYSDGKFYKGEFKDGVPNGHGILNYESLGSSVKLLKYEGNFVNGLPHGHGHLTYRDGSVYIGNFDSGVRNGRGVWKYQDLFSFEGIFNGDYFISGKKFINNQLKFEGMFIDKFPIPSFHAHLNSGYMKGISYDSDRCYKGSFNTHNNLEGEGEVYHKNGKLIYSGVFKNGLLSGKGKEYDPSNGTLKYEGYFRDGIYSGGGVFFDKSGKKLFDIDFPSRDTDFFLTEYSFPSKNFKGVKIGREFIDYFFIGKGKIKTKPYNARYYGVAISPLGLQIIGFFDDSGNPIPEFTHTHSSDLKYEQRQSAHTTYKSSSSSEEKKNTWPPPKYNNTSYARWENKSINNNRVSYPVEVKESLVLEINNKLVTFTILDMSQNARGNRDRITAMMCFETIGFECYNTMQTNELKDSLKKLLVAVHPDRHMSKPKEKLDKYTAVAQYIVSVKEHLIRKGYDL